MAPSPRPVVVGLLLSLAAALAHAGEEPQRLRAPAAAPDLLARARTVLDRSGVELLPLSAPATLAERLAIPVERQGALQLLELERHDLRAAGAVLRIVGADGTGTQELPPVSTYRGRVSGAPGTVVLASFGSDGLRATVLAGDSALWSVVPLGDVLADAPPGLHVAYDGDRAGPPVECGADALVAASALSAGDHLDPGAGQDLDLGGVAKPGDFVPPCLSLCEIAFDADFEYFQSKGSSVAGTVAAIDDIMNQVDFYYARDVRITYALTGYVVRTAPYYTPTGGGNLLDQFRAEWNTVQADIPRDIGHLMTGKPGSLIEFGGLAWVGVVCTESGYGWSMDGANIVGHEVGHNWNAPHCLDPTPCNNMCGACLWIAPITKGVIEAHRDSRTCLDEMWLYPTPLPPYVIAEEGGIRKRDFATTADVPFDVLANDEDGNCDTVTIASFDAVSERGGMVTLSQGTGPGGRDELLYTPPSVIFLGADSFGYDVGDGTGQTMSTSVTFEVRPMAVVGAWALDDASGTAATDDSGQAAHGTLVGGPVWTSGVHDGALLFDGVDDTVEVPPLDLFTDELTITAWVRSTGAPKPFAGIVFSRDGSTTAGLNLGLFGDLRYVWNNDFQSLSWATGLALPADTWTFVALSVAPGSTSISMHDGVAMQSASNTFDLGIEEFNGILNIGSDPQPGKNFAGEIDEVRVYDHALDAEQILAIHDLGGPAEAPRPLDGQPLVIPDGDLRWLAGVSADSHDVFVGTTFDDVQGATTASPEFVGNAPLPSLPAPALTPDTQYFWRVDERVGAATLAGDTWLMRRADFGHWKLDEASGSTAADAEGLLPGSFLGNPTLGEPGVVGTAVYFDGNGDRVQIPAMDLDTDRLTITTWLRRDGSQDPWAGIVFSRALSTVAGLNFGEANELRYHWEGGQWPWDSGLVVPNDTWVFVALVVEPDRARIFLGDGGVLTSATNAAGHGPEEFDGITLIARDGGFNNRYFQGWLDDVRIYDAALAAADLEDLYALGL